MPDGMREEAADVRVIPPLVYLLPFLSTALLHRFRPWGMPAFPGRRAAALTLIAAGQTVAAAGVMTFRKHDTTFVPNEPVKAMVTSGPYTYTRNPMYLGMTAMYLGGSLVIGSWWPVVVLPAVVAYVDRNVIRREEAYLRRRFGAAYEDFSRHTRRWL